MTELGIRVRLILGALPRGLERLVRTAVGDGPAWEWLPHAVPILTALAAAVAIGALELAAFQTAADYPPLVAVGLGSLGAGIGGWGILLVPRAPTSLGARLVAAAIGALAGGLLGTLLAEPIIRSPLLSAALAGLSGGLLVLGWRLQIAGTARAASRSIGLVPAVIGALVVLAAFPLLQAGAELIITRATVFQFVERQVGFSSTLVALEGYAVLSAFEAEPPIDPELGPDPRPHRWVLMRSDPGDRRMALVRTALLPGGLQDQAVTARVVDDPSATRDAADDLRGRGVDVPGAVMERMLVVPPPASGLNPDDAVRLASLEELDEVADGTLVQVELRFLGEAVATCALAGECDARRLGAGSGTWEQLATGAVGERPVIVRTPYPPTLAPVVVYGRQTADEGAVSRFTALPWIRDMTGWARLLRGAIVEHDPDLPVNRLWLGPILFGTTAVLLWLGRRVRYPVFVPQAVAGVDGPAGGEVRALATGRIAPPGRSPVDLDGTPVTLRADDDGITITSVPLGALEVRVPRGLGALSGVEPGELRSL
ncbi:MAG TPA: hypothetical protein VHK28_04265, partial [Candidatus Limnocylindria bacterium]|nr:hypothetical protein [Candidatus Limnocylindria bacterium]